jgi:DNA-binding MarR family transcriptional regulator
MALTGKRAAGVAGPPDIGIGKLLRRAHGAFSREFRGRLAEKGVTFGEFIHLERLWEEDGLNQTEISRRVEITTASSTQIIETLERRGLIVRKRNPGDRRNLNVFLTRAGNALEKELLECARATNRLARAGLSDGDTLTLFELVGRIIANLDGRAPVSETAREKGNPDPQDHRRRRKRPG